MNRREFFAAMSAAGAMMPMESDAAVSNANMADLKSAAREAWLYGLPLIEIANVRTNTAKHPKSGQMLRVNTLRHNRVLATAANREVTAPNVDTLYSSSFIDLSGGSVTLTIPPTGHRYISVAFMDMYTNNFCILGTRTTGPDGGTFTVVSPTAAAAPDAIRAPTPWVWMLVRLLVAGPADLDAAHKVQDGMALKAGNARDVGSYATRNASWAEYFASVQTLILENPPPATDTGFFHRVRALGLGPAQGFDAKKFSAAEASQIEAGVSEAHTSLKSRADVQPIQGWTYPPANLGVYGEDYAFRAGVALGGLAALPCVEAMYMGAVNSKGGKFFDDAGLKRLHFPAGELPPVDAFWSLTMYQPTPEGQSFLVANSLNRYAIGDRTPGLQKNLDGSLDIWIGRGDPGGARSSNWLPAPQSGPYSLSLRCYLPRHALLNGEYRVPALTQA